jgi:hypothetical protein
MVVAVDAAEVVEVAVLVTAAARVAGRAVAGPAIATA